jgi:hypothetical protein
MKQWFLATSVVLLGGVVLVGLWFGLFSRASESELLPTRATERTKRSEKAVEEFDVAKVATEAIRRDLNARLLRGASDEDAAVRRDEKQPIEPVNSEPALSSYEAQRRASELFVAARRSRKLTQENADRIVSLQRQMSGSEFDESVREFQEILNSPNVDTSEL